MDDPSWIRNCELLTRGLQSLDRSISTIRRSTNKVCTLKDIARERERVTAVTSGANSKDVQSIQDALQLLEKYIRLNPAQLSSQGAKLTMDAQTTLENYQQACNAFYKKCISVEEMYRNTQGGSEPSSKVSQNRKGGRGGVAVSFAGSDDDADETQNLLGGSKSNRGGTTQVQVQEDPHEDFERSLHEEIMAERNREAREIAENVKDIKEIFQHIHEIVGEQGVQLDGVEQNVSRADNATRNAVDQLRRAAQYQDDSQRNKMCLAFVMVVVFLVVVVLLFS